MTNAALKDLNTRFIYRSDTREKWRILKDAGTVWGDCEDYGLTLAWILSGRSMTRFWINILTFRFVIWHCLSPRGVGHAILWVHGHGWVDNIQRRFVSRRELRNKGYKLRYPHNAVTIALKFALSR